MVNVEVQPFASVTRKVYVPAGTAVNTPVVAPETFAGSSTTGIAANLANRRFLGIDMETEFLEMSKNRKLEIENPKIALEYKQKIRGFETKKQLELYLLEEPKTEYSLDLEL